MKLSTLLLASLPLVSATAHAAEKIEPPVPVIPGVAAPSYSNETYTYEQRLHGPAGSLIAPDKARQVVDAFRATYEKLGRPRLLVYVNRELVDTRSGLHLTGRSEKTETNRTGSSSSFEADSSASKTSAGAAAQTQINVAVHGSNGADASAEAGQRTPGKGTGETHGEKVSAENTYGGAAQSAATLADRQTVREIERLFGRPFRYAGATLTDQPAAVALIADKPLDHFTTPANDAARKDRDALARIADIVIEVLVSSRSLTVSEVSGDKTAVVPDIQVTAIKLSDSAVIGQASATDVLGRDQQAARIARQFDARDITEATALALMEDITTTAK